MAYDKIVDSAKLDTAMTATANAIRGKTGGTDQIAWDETTGFASAVSGIEATEAENLTDVLDSQEAKLNELLDILDSKASGGGAVVDDPVVQPLEVSENGTYTAPDGVDGYSPVTVNVPIPDGYIQPSGTLNITENGQYDVTDKAKVVINVESSGGTSDNTVIDKIVDRSITGFTSSTLKTVGQYAFQACTKLTKVDITATRINGYAFGASGLDTLILRSTSVVTLAAMTAFNGRYSTSWAEGDDYLGVLYVPSALISNYKSATNWSNLLNRGWDIQAIEGSEYE